MLFRSKTIFSRKKAPVPCKKGKSAQDICAPHVNCKNLSNHKDQKCNLLKSVKNISAHGFDFTSHAYMCFETIPPEHLIKKPFQQNPPGAHISLGDFIFFAVTGANLRKKLGFDRKSIIRPGRKAWPFLVI